MDHNFPMAPEVKILARHDATFNDLTWKLTEAEFEPCIDQLIRELENIRKEGKRKFLSNKIAFKEHHERLKTGLKEEK